MSSANPSSLTIEEAVALMINLDYIPTGFSLLELLAAFQEEAEVEHHNAIIDHLPADQLEALAIRSNACSARLSLARLIADHLGKEVLNQESSIFVPTSDSSNEPRLILKNISDWASDNYGIAIQAYQTLSQVGAVEPIQIVSWEAITIKIYADYKLAYSNDKGPYKRSSFQNIGLMGKRKNEPNHCGGILIGLSLQKKFPVEKLARNRDAAAISKLRRALKQLTEISGDPFYPFNEADGWKPRFKLIDDRRNADERAKDRASHVPFDESRDFDHEDDEAQRYIDNPG